MKKMRRMIPALCMLLVSAIMLSTASYAWFTMNDQVTASGMEIQAEAAGALVISDRPLNHAGGSPSVEFTTDKKTLTQITLNKTDGKWYQPDVNNDAVIDQVTGVVTGNTTLVEVPFTNATTNAPQNTSYFYDEEIYIGVAGEAKANHKLNVVLTAPSSAAGTATYAYAIAVYVLGVYETADGAAGAHAGVNDIPAAIVWVDKTEENGVPRNTAEINLSNFVIPSIEGVGQQDEKVTGLKVVLRMFVDGNLASGTPTYVSNSVALKSGDADLPTYKLENGEYVEDTISFDDTYHANMDYFILENVAGEDEEPEYVERPVIVPSDLQDGGDLPAGWYYYVDQMSQVYVKYVNNQNVPATGSTLSIKFTAVPPQE